MPSTIDLPPLPVGLELPLLPEGSEQTPALEGPEQTSALAGIEQLPIPEGLDPVAVANGALEIPPDLLEELNRLFENAAAANAAAQPSEEEIQRWMRLFNYTHRDAELLLKMHMEDIIRVRFPNPHWLLVHQDVQRAGHSRDSWEHLCGMKELLKQQSRILSDAEGKPWTVFRLGGLLPNTERVKEITGTTNEPIVTEAEIGRNGAVFKVVWVDIEQLAAIERWIDERLTINWDAGGPHAEDPLMVGPFA